MQKLGKRILHAVELHQTGNQSYNDERRLAEHPTYRLTDEANILAKNETVKINDNGYFDQITEAMVNKMDDITFYVKNNKETMQDEGLVECGIWDFAGQKEYYATHQTFLTTDAIYVIVADMTDDLEALRYDDQIKFNTAGGKIFK